MSQMIYLADDEKNIRDLMEAALTEEGFSVKTFPDGKTLLDVCGEKMPDLVILDVMMPGTDGFSACSVLRREAPDLPILIVSAKDSPYDRVTGLNLGSDDYLVKPFLPLELVARVKALFRRAEYSRTEAPTAFRCGNLLLEQGARTITVGGEAFSVTPTEFDFLSYLLERAGQAVSKQELMREIWKLPDYELDTRVADDLVKRLRRKLKEAGCSASVKTVWGFGFRLEGGKEGET